ncbi:MAG TPA: hypothetical protein VH302_01680 [Bryobacteraceae bacterium]|nr:hypothetical protein [Bryobacteraceae bacterium]
MRRSVAVNTADWKAQPSYVHQEVNLRSKVDSSGAAHPQQSKAFETMMIDGSPYQRLIAVNNEPLRGAQAEQEQAKMKREIARRASESASDHRARVAKYQNSRAEEHLLMQQMVEAFDFKLVGEETLEGAECYVMDACPRPGYQPPVERARVLTGMRGRLWIDKAEYHWVKVQAEVTSPVAFGLFVAQVKPGTKFELDQAPVGNVWLPKCFTESVNASVLGLVGYRTKEEEHYSDYRLTQVSASFRAAAP